MKAKWEMPKVELEAFELTNAVAGAACDSETSLSLDCLYGNQTESRALLSSAYNESACDWDCGYATGVNGVQMSGVNSYTRNYTDTLNYSKSGNTLTVTGKEGVNILGWLYVNITGTSEKADCTHGWTTSSTNYLTFSENCPSDCEARGVGKSSHVEYAAVLGVVSIGSN